LLLIIKLNGSLFFNLNLNYLLVIINNIMIDHKDNNFNTNTLILKNEEIMDFISKYFNLQVDIQVLRKPECDNIYDLYSKILDRANIVKLEKTNKLIYAGITKLSYPGLHDTTIFILKFFRQMKKFLNDILLINDFQTSDLFTPDQRRTRYYKISINTSLPYS